MKTSTSCLLACIALLPTILAGTPVKSESGSPKLIVVSWDGAPDWVVDRLLAEGKLPNLAKLIASGYSPESMIAAYPSKTAVGHASIFTGSWPNVHGVAGNSVALFPAKEHTLLETRSGFDSASLQAEPLYVTLAKAGLKVAVLSATQSYPAEPHIKALREANVPDDRYAFFSGFENTIASGKMYSASALSGSTSGRFSVQVGDTKLEARAYDDARDSKVGLDSVDILLGDKVVATLKPSEGGNNFSAWSTPIPVSQGNKRGNVAFRLFEMSPDGKSMALYQGKSSDVRGSGNQKWVEQYSSLYPCFHDDAFSSYEAGRFGKTAWEGGTGQAELRINEIVARDCRLLADATMRVMRNWQPDAIFHYTPMTDSAGHTWMGVLDPDSPKFNAALSKRLMPFYESVFAWQEMWLGAMMQTAGPSTVICLVSDHGMQGAIKTANVNVVLEQAGLLSRNAQGAIDLSRTKVFAPPSGDFFVCINGQERKGGIVPGSERAQVLAAARRALLEAKDPKTGVRFITQVFSLDEVAALGAGGALGGDLYLDFAEGYYPSGRGGKDPVSVADDRIGMGVHGYIPTRTKMRAILAMGGGKVPRGVTGPAVRQIDVAPTLCKLLGIAPPVNSTGTAIREVVSGK